METDRPDNQDEQRMAEALARQIDDQLTEQPLTPEQRALLQITVRLSADIPLYVGISDPEAQPSPVFVRQLRQQLIGVSPSVASPARSRRLMTALVMTGALAAGSGATLWINQMTHSMPAATRLAAVPTLTVVLATAAAPLREAAVTRATNTPQPPFIAVSPVQGSAVVTIQPKSSSIAILPPVPPLITGTHPVDSGTRSAPQPPTMAVTTPGVPSVPTAVLSSTSAGPLLHAASTAAVLQPATVAQMVIQIDASCRILARLPMTATPSLTATLHALGVALPRALVVLHDQGCPASGGTPCMLLSQNTASPSLTMIMTGHTVSCSAGQRGRATASPQGGSMGSP